MEKRVKPNVIDENDGEENALFDVSDCILDFQCCVLCLFIYVSFFS